jgi:hypothetical protein
MSDLIPDLPSRQKMIDTLESGDDIEVRFNDALGLALAHAMVMSLIKAYKEGDSHMPDCILTLKGVGK